MRQKRTSKILNIRKKKMFQVYFCPSEFESIIDCPILVVNDGVKIQEYTYKMSKMTQSARDVKKKAEVTVNH